MPGCGESRPSVVLVESGWRRRQAQSLAGAGKSKRSGPPFVLLFVRVWQVFGFLPVKAVFGKERAVHFFHIEFPPIPASYLFRSGSQMARPFRRKLRAVPGFCVAPRKHMLDATYEKTANGTGRNADRDSNYQKQ